MEPIQIVSQFRQLAAEPGNRVFMAGECLPSVVTFLQLDPECARVALETLYCLALEPANVSTLESYPGLADAVTDWTINGVGATGEAAEKCLSVIFPSLDGDDATPAPGPEPAAAEPEATPTGETGFWGCFEMSRAPPSACWERHGTAFVFRAL